MNKKFVGFGELLLRLTPEGYLRFRQASRFNLNYTGAEGNMCIALANMGMDAALVSKIPDNEIGQCALDMLERYGVNTEHVPRGGERLGVYYLEKGASQRPSKIIYDRKYSSISQAEPSEFDWEKILQDAGWFHFTGITAALSDNCAQMCLDACRCARSLGIKVSCDLNYRKNLWSTEKARSVMIPLMEYVDVLFANEEDSGNVLNVHADDSNIEEGKLSIEGYSDLAFRLKERFGFERVCISLRESLSASDNNWSGLMYADGKTYVSRKYPIHLVDRVGGGDSFASGMIYALMNEYENQEAIEFAVAASCLKQTIEYDFNLASVDEVKALMKGSGSGRVQR
ncbi:MAG: sugar kinase [Erysipelotrichaceae bacterium]|nr:sugar kinase [Erysipelotrichaceae bacterium]